MGKKLTCAAVKCGHTLWDGDVLTFTNYEAAEGYTEILTSLVSSMAKDISEITNIPIDKVIRDYVEENELDIMNASFNAVLRKKGYKIEPTVTRCGINRIIKR